MKVFNKWTIIIGIIIVLNIIGFKYLVADDVSVYLMFNFFLVLSGFIVLKFWNGEIKKRLFYLFLFIPWLYHNGLAFIRASYLDMFTLDRLINTYFIVIFSTLLLLFGIYLSKGVKVSGFKFLNNGRISRETYFVFLLLFLILNFVKLYIAGGIVNYTLAGYENKLPQNLKTIFFVLDGIMVYFTYLNILMIKTSKTSFLKFISFVVLLFIIFLNIISGSTLGVLSILLTWLLFVFFTAKSRFQIKKVSKYFIPVIVFGITLGILIRFNRSDYGSFTFKVLDDMVINVITSPTFDCIENLTKVIRDFKPTYSLDQAIYPLVNFLPRNIFPWKPMELGRLIAEKYYGFDKENIGGFGPSAMGEFYYDFGYLGIIVGMICLGLFIGILQRKFNKTTDSVNKWILLIPVAALSGTLVNWYSGYGIRLVYFVLFMFLLLFIEGFFRRLSGR